MEESVSLEGEDCVKANAVNEAPLNNVCENSSQVTLRILRNLRVSIPSHTALQSLRSPADRR